MVPVGFTDAAGARVFWTAAVGMGVAVTPPEAEGTDVGGGTEVFATGSAVAVAEDPQANSKTTNSRTIACGRCLINRGLDLDFGTAGTPLKRHAKKYVWIT